MGWFKKAWRKIKKAAKKVAKAIKKAVKKVVNTVKKVLKAIKDVVYKIVGLFDQALSLLGIRPKKYLRLKVIVLRKDDKPIHDLKEVQAWYDMTKKVLLEKCNIEVRPPNLHLSPVELIGEDAPSHAFKCNCSFGSAFSDDNDYYETLTHYSVTSSSSAIMDFFGYGEPLYAIVIEDITGASGCAVPLLNKYVLLDRGAGKTTLSHEFGHITWLAHKNKPRNLMNTNRDRDVDYELTNWQISNIRNSRYVVYAPRKG